MLADELLATYGPRLLAGLLTTLGMVVVSFSLGAVLALPLCMARLSSRPLPQRLAGAYIGFFRGTPVLLQLFMLYYGLAQFRPTLQAMHLWWLFKDALFCAVATFALNTAAYQAEILRGAWQAVAKGQREAIWALGLRTLPGLVHVLMPQVLLVALRPLISEFILLIKGSAVASTVTVAELMSATNLAFSRSFDFNAYLWAALIYVLIVESIRRLGNRACAHLTRHLSTPQGNRRA